MLKGNSGKREGHSLRRRIGFSWTVGKIFAATPGIHRKEFTRLPADGTAGGRAPEPRPRRGTPTGEWSAMRVATRWQCPTQRIRVLAMSFTLPPFPSLFWAVPLFVPHTPPSPRIVRISPPAPAPPPPPDQQTRWRTGENPCSRCSGEGMVECAACHGRGVGSERAVRGEAFCLACEATGVELCPRCQGDGWESRGEEGNSV